MKSLCFILILLLPFAFFSCSVEEDADFEDNPPGSNLLISKSHYVVCKGIVAEKATNVPIQGMRMRITKELSNGNTDSVYEVTTNEFGEYQMKFWYDKHASNYLLQTISDSTLLPNPNYFDVAEIYDWGFREGQLYKTGVRYKLDAGIEKSREAIFNPKIQAYGYVTLRLKQKSGYEEPIMTYKILVNDTIKYSSLIPVLKDSDFGKTLVFSGNEPQKIEIRVYRAIQSNKYVSKTIIPVPTKLIVEEFEF